MTWLNIRSPINLCHGRAEFYQKAVAAYRERGPIVQTASGQSERPFSLSWSHYVFLLGIKKADERSFYEIEATTQN